MTKYGVQPHESNERYHARSELSPSQLSSSQLELYIREPLTFWYEHVAKERWPREQTDDMTTGTKIHEMLETHKAPVAITIPNDVLAKNGARSGNKWKEWKAQQPPDAELLKEGERDWRVTVWNHLQRNDRTRSILSYIPECREVTVTWEHQRTGLPCRCRFDVLDIDNLFWCDWKTTYAPTPDEFARHVVRQRYHVRWAFYVECLREIFKDFTFPVVVCIRSRRPYDVYLYQIPGELLEIGRDEMNDAMELLVSENWEQYLNRPVVELPMPRWIPNEFETEEASV